MNNNISLTNISLAIIGAGRWGKNHVKTANGLLSPEQITVCDFSEAAREIWIKTYPGLTDPKPGMAGRVCDRAETHTLRLALTFALLDKSHAIEPQHLDAALAFWRFAEQSASYIFGDAGENPVENKILSMLKSNPQGLSTTEIIKLFSYHINKKELSAAIGSLEATGKVSIKTTKTKGRPKKIIQLAKKAN